MGMDKSKRRVKGKAKAHKEITSSDAQSADKWYYYYYFYYTAKDTAQPVKRKVRAKGMGMDKSKRRVKGSDIASVGAKSLDKWYYYYYYYFYYTAKVPTEGKAKVKGVGKGKRRVKGKAKAQQSLARAGSACPSYTCSGMDSCSGFS